MALSSPNQLVPLPVELLNLIYSNLTNRDIKNLRLVNRRLGGTASLRLTRVFSSANPRNIAVFRAVADHDGYRKAVVEIIWDDARFSRPSTPGQGFESLFSLGCKNNEVETQLRKGSDKDLPHHVSKSQEVKAQLSTQEAWAYYEGLQLQQSNVLKSNANIDAFKYGLKQFPSLKRIATTPAAHGFLHTPLYQTPMIRAFPYGFNHLIPRSWPFAYIGHRSPQARCWDSIKLKERWRGVRIVLWELAQNQHQVSELLIDAHYLNSGLNCQLFDRPCDEYYNLVTLLGSSGFRRLDLDLAVGGQEKRGWSSFRRGYLHKALAKATDLEHISMRADMGELPLRSYTFSGGLREHHIPLCSIFPIDEWSRLKYFGISGFLVTREDLISVLAALPATLRFVELSFLSFMGEGGNYKALLERMRDRLNWHDKKERRRVRIGVKLSNPIAGRAIWLDDAVYDFLYHAGENPFGQGNGGPNQVAFGMGFVKDAFEPAHERPYVDFNTYVDFGYYNKST